MKHTLFLLCLLCGYVSHSQTIRPKTIPWQGGKKYAFDLTYSPSGEYLAVSRKNHVEIWRTQPYQMEKSIETGEEKVTAISYGNNAALLVTGSRDGTLRIWNTLDGFMIREIAAHEGPISSIKVSSDGSRIASAGFDGMLRWWDFYEGSLVADFKHGRTEIMFMDLSHDQRFAVTAGYNGTMKVWDLNQEKLFNSLIGIKGPIKGISLGPDSRTLAAFSEGKTIWLWNLSVKRNREPVGAIETLHKDWIAAVGYHPENGYLLSVDYQQQMVLSQPLTEQATRSAKNAERHEYKLQDAFGNRLISSVAFNPANHQLAIGTLGKGVLLLDSFRKLFEYPHFIRVFQVNDQELPHEGDPLMCYGKTLRISGSISRAAFLQEAYLLVEQGEDEIKVPISPAESGHFTLAVDIELGESEVTLVALDQNQKLPPSFKRFGVWRKR
ncbi:MAG: WD40 repeat domain-containing protein [Bacteroidota bacterium]